MEAGLEADAPVKRCRRYGRFTWMTGVRLMTRPSPCLTILCMMTTLPDDLSDLALRLVAATMCGGAIGFDRELRHKPAGLRTHALVSLGASLVTVLVLRTTPGYEHVDALSRVIQGVLAGVGFLGAGSILRNTVSTQEQVHGLTTAATIWIVAALGIACGVGQWSVALIAVSVALFVLVAGGPFEGLLHRIFKKKEP